MMLVKIWGDGGLGGILRTRGGKPRVRHGVYGLQEGGDHGGELLAVQVLSRGEKVCTAGGQELRGMRRVGPM